MKLVATYCKESEYDPKRREDFPEYRETDRQKSKHKE